MNYKFTFKPQKYFAQRNQIAQNRTTQLIQHVTACNTTHTQGGTHHEHRLCFENVNLIHGDASRHLQPNMTLLVNEQGLIENITPDQDPPIPSHYKTIDLTGKYVMPGLINAHVHLLPMANRSPSPLVKVCWILPIIGF